MERSMNKFTLGILLTVIGFFGGGMSGCVLLTRFESYSLQLASGQEKQLQIEPSATTLHVAFFNTHRETWIVPGFYSADVAREPLRHNLVIWGPFEELDAIAATIQLDEQAPTSLEIDLEKMNASRKKHQDGRNIFVMKDESFKIEVPWDDFAKVTVRATVEATIDGEPSTFELSREFGKRYHKIRTGNRLLSALMSI
jgi:hypothetical protein